MKIYKIKECFMGVCAIFFPEELRKKTYYGLTTCVNQLAIYDECTNVLDLYYGNSWRRFNINVYDFQHFEDDIIDMENLNEEEKKAILKKMI